MPDCALVLRNRAVYWLSWFAGVGSVVLFVVIAIDGPGPEPKAGDHIVAVVISLSSALVALRATRLRVEMTDAGITVYKLLTTERIGWRDVDDVTVDYAGLHIERTSGEVVTARSMGTSMVARWFYLDGGERRARQIQARAAAEKRRA